MTRQRWMNAAAMLGQGVGDQVNQVAKGEAALITPPAMTFEELIELRIGQRLFPQEPEGFRQGNLIPNRPQIDSHVDAPGKMNPFGNLLYLKNLHDRKMFNAVAYAATLAVDLGRGPNLPRGLRCFITQF